MKTITFLPFLSILFLSFIITACDDDDDDCITDLGEVLSETRDVSSFHSISFDGVGNIFLTQGSQQSLRIEANERVLDLFDTKVSNGLLDAELDGCIQGNNFQLDVYVTIPDIRLLSLNGVGNITAQNDWDLDDLMVDMNGVGNIVLRGTVDNLDINSNGVGNVKAFDLIAKTCNVDVTGTGNVEIHATDELDVTINGTANVLYKGDPTISITINGSGNLIDSN